jgi:hypothetical protein
MQPEQRLLVGRHGLSQCRLLPPPGLVAELTHLPVVAYQMVEVRA